MILREWRGRAAPGREGAYPAHFRACVVQELREVPGFLAAELVRRDIGDAVEFTVLTRWASMAAIRAFAGDDTAKAVVEPGAVAALQDYDEHVTHHEVIDSVTPEAG